MHQSTVMLKQSNSVMSCHSISVKVLKDILTIGLLWWKPNNDRITIMVNNSVDCRQCQSSGQLLSNYWLSYDFSKSVLNYQTTGFLMISVSLY
jgi:hypothetical protein